MMCPRCQSDEKRVLHTFQFDDFTKRQCYCQNCGLQFDTVERIVTEYRYSGELKKTVAVAIQIQAKGGGR